MTLRIPEKLKPFARVEVVLLLILILAIVLRFIFLDLKLYHHDEATHAWISYNLMNSGFFTYDPAYHGPFLYYVTSAMFKMFDVSDLVGRILPCVFGCALIPLLYWIYRMRFISGKVVCIASLFIAISPCMLYFSRFLRNDVFVIFFSLLMIAAMLAWMTRKKWYWLALAGLAAALGLSCKENMPIIIGTFVIFFLYLLWTKKFTLPKNWWLHLILALIVFFAVVFTFYTSFWQHPEMMWKAGKLAIEHWFDVQANQRIPGPPYYYFGILVLYELPIALLAIWGIIRYFLVPKSERSEDTKFLSYIRRPAEPRTINREREFMLFAIFWMIVSMIAYAVIGEKVPWLILHQLLPMILVAAYGLSMLSKKWMAFFGILTVAFLIWATGITVYNANDICGPIVQVQNSEQLRPLMAVIDNATSVAIYSSEALWPLSWYYAQDWYKINYNPDSVPSMGGSDTQVYYLHKFIYNPDPVPRDAAQYSNIDVILMHDLKSYDSLDGYTKIYLPEHYWMDATATGYGDGRTPQILNWIKYFFTRSGSIGSLNIAVFLKNSTMHQYIDWLQ